MADDPTRSATAGLRLYVAQYVMVYEDQWFAPDTDGPPIRSEKCYRVVSQLYAATHAEEAYRLAVSWLPGMRDSSHDGDGDLLLEYSTGLHQIEEVTSGGDDLQLALRDDYGVEVGRYDPRDVDADGMPTVRAKSELEIFRGYNSTDTHD